MSKAVVAVLLFLGAVGIQSSEPRASARAESAEVKAPDAPQTPQHPSKVQGDAEDLLAAVPANAALVVTVRDLASFDAKLKNLSEQLGLLPVSPYLLFKGQLEIVAGIEDHGSAAILVMPSDEPGSVAKNMPMLLPATDLTQMLAFLNPQPADEGYTKVTLRGRESYVGTKGPFAVFGADLNTVKSVIAAKSSLGDRFSSYQRKQFAENDVSIWVDPASLDLSPLADLPPVRFLHELGEGSGWLKRYKSVQTSLRVEPDGIAVELYARRSESGKAMSTGESSNRQPTVAGNQPAVAGGQPAVGKSLLPGLPDEPCILAMRLTGDGAGRRAASIGHLMISIGRAFEVLEPTRSKELCDAVDRIVAKTGDAAVSITALPESPDGLIGLAKVVQIRGESRALMDEIDPLLRTLASGVFVDPTFNRAMEKLEYRREAEVSAGVSVDHLAVDLNQFEGVDQAAVTRAVGKEGLLLRIGVVDKEYLVATFGGGPARFDAVVAAVRASRKPVVGGGPLLGSNQRTGTSAQKPTIGRLCEGRFAVDRLVGLINSVSRAMDLPSRPAAMPELGAPISWAMSPAGLEAVQLDLFIPTEVVVALKDAAVQRAARRMDSPPRPEP